ncbi:hypothetical protein EUTSA_v10005430mg [Eutrema salsugineum]|uniref:Cystatin domain-containing protein n=1 Tax=Eutrema salsugineum TaxID=72664 RepID=V4ML04_EUTSA|nr:uncharacterized protein LOC18011758 [Eutrema salsugineum]ESQ32081.1 hypothetical protein EUTSA_v10005430mg [Eutrema salsugineum]
MNTSMSTIIIFFMTFSVVFVAVMAEKINPEEICIRRNIARSQPPSSSAEPKISKFDIFVDQYCRDTGRAIMFYVRVNRKFPSHYVKMLCNIYENDEKRVMDYILKRWLGFSKLAYGLTCVSH